MRAGPVLETVLYAEDLAAAREFYASVLGLEEYRFAASRFAFFRCGQQMLLIFDPRATRTQSEGPPPHGTIGAGHVCFRASRQDIEAWQEHLMRAGVVIEKLIDWPEGGRSLYFRDPAGNSVEFAEPRIWGLPEIRSLRDSRIVIATHNRGKLQEFAELLKPHGVDAISAGELGIPEPVETEATFEGNARIKAVNAAEHSGLVALADDSGLCVEALGGDPGVYTADWAGPDRDWMRAMRLVEEKLAAKGATTPDRRRAAFVCTLCVRWPDGEERLYVGKAPGHLVWPPRGTFGHGYDPVFVPDGATRTFAEMTNAEKNRLSHRGRALVELLRDLF